MLVMTREVGEKIFIGDDICITVVLIDRTKVRVGVEAPRSVPIYRQELIPPGKKPSDLAAGAAPAK